MIELTPRLFAVKAFSEFGTYERARTWLLEDGSKTKCPNTYLFYLNAVSWLDNTLGERGIVKNPSEFYAGCEEYRQAIYWATS